MQSPHIARLDFELAYLVLLTEAGVKPLSRWERRLDTERLCVVQDVGLKTAVVHRSVRSGRMIEEVVFGRADVFVDTYVRRFDGTPIDKSPQTQRLEGFLFGYPSCCVEHFIRKGYVPNGLAPEDQKILFHWACRECTVTPLLLPRYRDLLKRCRALLAEEISQEDREGMRRFKQGIAVAASLALLASGPGVVLPKAIAQGNERTVVPVSFGLNEMGDRHLIPLPAETDSDGDLLGDDEETHVGTDPHNPDTDSDGVADGVQLAKALRAMVEDLPTEAGNTEPYRIDHFTFGYETCDACGATRNMGFVEIVNPELGLSVEIPYVGLHFMEYGSFSYSGDIHTGRVNVPLLNAVVRSEPDVHWLPIEGDSDSDGLADEDETYFGTDEADPDTDDDGVMDGVGLAMGMWSSIQSLPRDTSDTEPYAEELEMDGTEICQSCGEVVNMGGVLITNPLEELTVIVPYIGLHYMEHGSFAYEGDYHGRGVVNSRLVHCILESRGAMHVLPVDGDTDGDGLRDEEEPRLETDPDNPDTDGDGIVDGVELAKEMRGLIADLPRSESASETYMIEHSQRGYERCEICGGDVNMGYVEIVNPLEELSIEIPYVGLHYMEHGSFAYSGSIHKGRADVRLLDTILTSDGTAHLLPVEGDTDGDGLTDDEEPRFKTDPADPDTDGDGVFDGIEVAKHMREVISGLPTSERADETYVIEHGEWGHEWCEICGDSVNMGFVEIVNPLEGLSIEIPYIGLHYMEHGSFAYSGSIHEGRADVRLLDTILTSDGTAHLLPVEGDTDGDGLTDVEESHFNTDPANPDSDGDGVLDGVFWATLMRSSIAELDTIPSEAEPYVVNHTMRGTVMCPVCGASANMGYVEVVNVPKDLRAEVPYLGLHFMEHGSFAYGSGPEERVDPIQIGDVLNMPMKGDVNGDGHIDVSDVISVVTFIVGAAEPTPAQFWAADVNGDGRLNVLDVVHLVRSILESGHGRSDEISGVE